MKLTILAALAILGVASATMSIPLQYRAGATMRRMDLAKRIMRGEASLDNLSAEDAALVVGDGTNEPINDFEVCSSFSASESAGTLARDPESLALCSFLR